MTAVGSTKNKFLKLSQVSPGEQLLRSQTTCPAPGSKQLDEQENNVLSNSNENNWSEMEKLLTSLRWTQRQTREKTTRATYHRRTNVRILTNQFLYDSWVH